MTNRIMHFGIEIKNKSTNNISRDKYLLAKPEGMTGWTEEHYEKQRIKAAINFDANMKYFAQLDKKEFNKYLQKMCKKYKFVECLDINLVKELSGLYIMVLDNYKQFYIGKSSDIKKRIQQHWNKKKSLERLVFGDMCNSILSIDSFGALDTTRIFYKECRSSDLDVLEEKLVNIFDTKYMLNRTSGGIGSSVTYTDDLVSTQIAVLAGKKKRCLIDYVDMEATRNFFEQSGENEKLYYISKYPNLKEFVK